MTTLFRLLLISLCLLTASASYAEADALMNGSAITTGVQTAMKVINVGSYTHVLTYVTVGTTASISIQIEGSTNNGTSYTLCGSASTTIPVPAIPVQCTGIYSHIRVNITTLTGAAPQVLFSLYSVTLSGGTNAAATQVQGTVGDGVNPSGTNPLTLGWIKSNGATTFGKSPGYISGNISGATAQDQILATGSAFVSYTPAQLGVNALTLPASTFSAISNIIDTRGVKELALISNCGQIYHIWFNYYAEDGTTVLASNNQVVGSAGASLWNVYRLSSVTATPGISFGTAGVVAQQFALPARAISVLFFNTTATPSTCTARLFLQY